jgi:hypothetical protein
MLKRIFFLPLIFTLFLISSSWAIPEAIVFSGKLTPIPSDPYNTPVAFKIYNVPTGGTPVWEWAVAASDLEMDENGIFSIALGPANNGPEFNYPNMPFSIWTANALYLAVEIDGSELSPRQNLYSVPYAYIAKDQIGGVSYAVGRLETNYIGVTGSGDTAGGSFSGTGAAAYGLKAESAGGGGRNEPWGGSAVYGKNVNTSHGGPGLYGESVKFSGVYGRSLTDVNASEDFLKIGVVGLHGLVEPTAKPVAGVYGESNDIGVYGKGPIAGKFDGVVESTVGFKFPDGTVQTTAGAGGWTLSGDNVYKETGNVGIGMTNPSRRLDVSGGSATDVNKPVLGVENTGVGPGIQGEGDGGGIWGFCNAALGTTNPTRRAGVYGRNSLDGPGVYAQSQSGYGLQASAGGSKAAIYAENDAPAGVALELGAGRVKLKRYDHEFTSDWTSTSVYSTPQFSAQVATVSGIMSGSGIRQIKIQNTYATASSQILLSIWCGAIINSYTVSAQDDGWYIVKLYFENNTYTYVKIYSMVIN